MMIITKDVFRNLGLKINGQRKKGKQIRTILICLILVTCTLVWAGEAKVYQQAKLLDYSSEDRSMYNYTTYNNYGTLLTVPNRYNFKDYFIIIGLGDLVIMGSYTAKFRWTYKPNWIIGDIVNVRIDGDKLFIQRPDGKELKTTIVKRSRVIPEPQTNIPEK